MNYRASRSCVPGGLVDDSGLRGGVRAIDGDDGRVWVGLVQRIKGSCTGIRAKCLVVEIRLQGGSRRQLASLHALKSGRQLPSKGRQGEYVLHSVRAGQSMTADSGFRGALFTAS